MTLLEQELKDLRQELLNMFLAVNNQLTKSEKSFLEFDKDLALKSKTYIKSYSKIDDSIITIEEFLNYIENLDEELFKLFKAYTSSNDQDAVT